MAGREDFDAEDINSQAALPQMEVLKDPWAGFWIQV